MSARLTPVSINFDWFLLSQNFETFQYFSNFRLSIDSPLASKVKYIEDIVSESKKVPNGRYPRDSTCHSYLKQKNKIAFYSL